MISGKYLKSMLMLVSIIFFMLASCNMSNKVDNNEEEQIGTFLALNDTITFQHSTSGLYYTDLVVGTGPQPVTHDSVFIKHTIMYLSGFVIYSNLATDDTLKVPVNEGYLLTGFDEGITYMHVGGRTLLLLPSNLAYGPSGYMGIPGYTPLLIDARVVKLKSYPFIK
jgi:FKBP-type peptidyl-prolyl cis-trans isomerase FkpA